MGLGGTTGLWDHAERFQLKADLLMRYLLNTNCTEE
jgi:hypothetical protein